METIESAAYDSLPYIKYNKDAKQYWNGIVKQAHTNQRNARIKWIGEGNTIIWNNFDSYRKFQNVQKDDTANVDKLYDI